MTANEGNAWHKDNVVLNAFRAKCTLQMFVESAIDERTHAGRLFKTATFRLIVNNNYSVIIIPVKQPVDRIWCSLCSMGRRT